MGYLPDMFKSPIKGFRQYLLCVGQNREAVVYALNDVGEPVTLACGKVEDVLGHAFNEISPDFRLNVRTKRSAWSGLEEIPVNYGFSYARWRELAGVMNGKGFRSGYATAGGLCSVPPWTRSRTGNSTGPASAFAGPGRTSRKT